MFCTYSNCIMPFWTSMRSELRHFFIVNWKAFRAKSLPPVQSDWWKRYLQTRCIKQAYTQIRSAKCESHTRENSYYNFTCKTQVQQEYCEFSWLAVSVGWKGMIFPLQASIGPALWHNDPEKEGVDSLIRQEAMGYYQKNLRLKPWGLTCPSFQGIPKFVPERVKDGGEPSIRCISAWGVEMIKFEVILSLTHCRSCVQLWTNDVLWMWVHPIHIFMPQEAKAPERHSFFTGWGTEEDWVNVIVQWQKEDNDQWFSKVFLPGIPHLKLAVSEQCLNWNADEIWQTQTSPVISPLCLSDCCQRLSGKPLLRSMAIFQRHKNGCFAEAVSFSHSFSVLCCILRLNRIFSLLMKYVINYYHPQSFLLWYLLSLLAFF